MAKILTIYDEKEYITVFEKECNDSEADFAAKVAMAYSETADKLKIIFHAKVDNLFDKYISKKINQSEFNSAVEKVLAEAQVVVTKLGEQCSEAFNDEYFGEENCEDDHKTM